MASLLNQEVPLEEEKYMQQDEDGLNVQSYEEGNPVG